MDLKTFDRQQDQCISTWECIFYAWWPDWIKHESCVPVISSVWRRSPPRTHSSLSLVVLKSNWRKVMKSNRAVRNMLTDVTRGQPWNLASVLSNEYHLTKRAWSAITLAQLHYWEATKWCRNKYTFRPPWCTSHGTNWAHSAEDNRGRGGACFIVYGEGNLLSSKRLLSALSVGWVSREQKKKKIIIRWSDSSCGAWALNLL